MHVVVVVLVLVLTAGGLVILAVLTSGSWLSWILSRLDRTLARMKFGTWSARALTWAENYVWDKIRGHGRNS